VFVNVLTRDLKYLRTERNRGEGNREVRRKMVISVESKKHRVLFRTTERW